jgi:hypothetical protein
LKYIGNGAFSMRMFNLPPFVSESEKQRRFESFYKIIEHRIGPKEDINPDEEVDFYEVFSTSYELSHTYRDKFLFFLKWFYITISFFWVNLCKFFTKIYKTFPFNYIIKRNVIPYSNDFQSTLFTKYALFSSKFFHFLKTFDFEPPLFKRHPDIGVKADVDYDLYVKEQWITHNLRYFEVLKWMGMKQINYDREINLKNFWYYYYPIWWEAYQNDTYNTFVTHSWFFPNFSNNTISDDVYKKTVKGVKIEFNNKLSSIDVIELCSIDNKISKFVQERKRLVEMFKVFKKTEVTEFIPEEALSKLQSMREDRKNFFYIKESLSILMQKRRKYSILLKSNKKC